MSLQNFLFKFNAGALQMVLKFFLLGIKFIQQLFLQRGDLVHKLINITVH